jgi:hypothetical protein
MTKERAVEKEAKLIKGIGAHRAKSKRGREA